MRMISSSRIRAGEGGLLTDVLRHACARLVHGQVLRVRAIDPRDRAAAVVPGEPLADLGAPLSRLERRDSGLLADQSLVGPSCSDGIWNIRRQAVLMTIVDRHSERVHCASDHRELSDRKDRVHRLMRIVFGGQRAPRAIADERIDVQLVRGSKKGRFERIPPGCLWPASNARQFRTRDAGFPGAAGVLCPDVFRATQPGGPQNEQLAMARRQG